MWPVGSSEGQESTGLLQLEPRKRGAEAEEMGWASWTAAWLRHRSLCDCSDRQMIRGFPKELYCKYHLELRPGHSAQDHGIKTQELPRTGSERQGEASARQGKEEKHRLKEVTRKPGRAIFHGVLPGL